MLRLFRKSRFQTRLKTVRKAYKILAFWGRPQIPGAGTSFDSSVGIMIDTECVALLYTLVLKGIITSIPFTGVQFLTAEFWLFEFIVQAIVRSVYSSWLYDSYFTTISSQELCFMWWALSSLVSLSIYVAVYIVFYLYWDAPNSIFYSSPYDTYTKQLNKRGLR